MKFPKQNNRGVKVIRKRDLSAPAQIAAQIARWLNEKNIFHAVAILPQTDDAPRHTLMLIYNHRSVLIEINAQNSALTEQQLSSHVSIKEQGGVVITAASLAETIAELEKIADDKHLKRENKNTTIKPSEQILRDALRNLKRITVNLENGLLTDN